MGAHVQDTSRVATATGLHRHLDDLLFDLRSLSGMARVQKKRASVSISARPAAVALFAFRRLVMQDHIGALAMGTMHDLDDHGFSSRAWVSLSRREDRATSTALEHLRIGDHGGERR
jgi:hypothetical protein